MRTLGRWIAVVIVLLLGRGKRPPALPPGREPHRADPRAETAVLLLLLLVPLGALAFCVVYFTSADTQQLAVALGGAFVVAGLAAGLASKRVVPQEEEEEPRPELEHPQDEDEVLLHLEESHEGITRKRLLTLATFGAGGALAAALVVPALSCGPEASEALSWSPWRRGRRLVDEHGKPIAADELDVGGTLTAFAEHADKERLASSLVVVRLRPDELHLPDDRRHWAPNGLLAFSRICPHAGCAVSEFRYPLYDPTSPRPALVCPCHYSTFDVARGGDRIFGPAGRALPQLPLAIADDGTLMAAGELSGRVGPSWWGVRKGNPT